MCGLTVFTGDALGPQYVGHALVCESLTNLITRRVLQPVGPSFVARRHEAETDQEFLASTDNWFHPVQLASGPDGALYVVDFYRELVEHPLYVANETVRAEVDWRHGAAFGRIWRVRSNDGTAPIDRRPPRLSRASGAELVELLAHPSGWRRLTAQRLLVERQDRTVVPQLRALLTESSAAWGRLHALYVLDGLDAGAASLPAVQRDDAADSPALDVASLRGALRDADPNVRRHAVQLAAERLQASGEQDAAALRAALSPMSGDPDSSVRFRLALAMRWLDGPEAADVLAKLLETEDSPATRLAVLCGAGRHAWPLMKTLLDDPVKSRRLAAFIEQFGEHFATQAREESLAECLRWLAAEPRRSRHAGGLAALAGVTRGLFKRGATLLDHGLPPERLAPSTTERLRGSVAAAEAMAADASQAAEDRARAAVLAANGGAAAAERLARELVRPSQPQIVQSAAMWAVGHAQAPGAWQAVFSGWADHTTATRQAMLDQAVQSPPGAEALVAALEDDLLSPEEIPASVRVVLGQTHDASLRGRVEPILAAVAAADRGEVLARYAPVAGRRGNSERGARVYQKTCQTCHDVHGAGKKVGPDLASVSARRSELLLEDILNPSHQVSPGFVSYVALTQEGRVLSGLVAAETADSVTLRREEGQQETIRRSDLVEFRASGKSMMPDGLEQEISPDQMADLLEFLHQPDVNLLK